MVRIFQFILINLFRLSYCIAVQVNKINLNYKEQNALRYTAGSVANALINEVKRSIHPLKEEMMCC